MRPPVFHPYSRVQPSSTGGRDKQGAATARNSTSASAFSPARTRISRRRKAIPLHETDTEEENAGTSSSPQTGLDQHMEPSAFVEPHSPPSPGLPVLPMLDEKTQDSFLGQEEENSQAEPVSLTYRLFSPYSLSRSART